LVEFSKTKIPPELHFSTPILLYATAGLRLLKEDRQREIMKDACAYLSLHFNVHDCNTNIRVITGELEGLFGWITVNYLKTKFAKSLLTAQSSTPQTFGFIDVGGASAQIAFQPTLKLAKTHQDDLQTITIRYTDGSEIELHIFVGTFLGFGVNQARTRYLQSYQERDDPCLPLGLIISSTIEIEGTGDFLACMDRITPILNKNLKCHENPCLFNGLHAPIENFSNHRFIGISEIWYTTFDVYNIGGQYNYQELYNQSKSYCETKWTDILKQYHANEIQNVETIERLYFHCFKSAYILSILHKGFSFPTEDTSLESMEKFDGIPVSWTLGAIFMYASSGIHTNPRIQSNLQKLGTLEILIVSLFSSVGLGFFFVHKYKCRFKKILDLSRYHRNRLG
jgi:Golgi nucleoside diphosphatase